MAIIKYKNFLPKIYEDIFLAPDSWVIGRVTIQKDCSIFFGAVLRGDVQPISVGTGTNIQEHAMLHGSVGLTPCVVGDYVTIGHRAIIHGCTIGNNCIIGMGATILDGAEISENCIIGANSLVPMNMKIPSNSLAFGTPAKVIRSLSTDEIASIQASADNYIVLGKQYRELFLGMN